MDWTSDELTTQVYWPMKMLKTLAVEFECKIHAKCPTIGSYVADANFSSVSAVVVIW